MIGDMIKKFWIQLKINIMVDEIDLHHVQQTANNNIPPPNFRLCAGLRGHKIKTTTVTPAGFPNIT